MHDLGAGPVLWLYFGFLGVCFVCWLIFLAMNRADRIARIENCVQGEIMPEHANAFFWGITPARVYGLQALVDEDGDACDCAECCTVRMMLEEAYALGIVPRPNAPAIIPHA